MGTLAICSYTNAALDFLTNHFCLLHILITSTPNLARQPYYDYKLTKKRKAPKSVNLSAFL